MEEDEGNEDDHYDGPEIDQLCAQDCCVTIC